MQSPSDNFISNINQLEDVLSTPNQRLIDFMGKLDGDIIVLGAGGKMGPTLTRMAKRASEECGVTRRVIAVSRFSAKEEQTKLQESGVETISADLLNSDQIDDLPEVENVIFMVGMKFGSVGNEPMTWAVNSYLPGAICKKFKNSRMAVFSSGNVYGLSPVKKGGSVENDVLNPKGEYAMSVMGRERVFEYFSKEYGIPISIIRLNYACELRYGILVDIARTIASGEPVDISMSCFNTIWQRDANIASLLSLEHAASPAFVFNLTGPEILLTRNIALKFGELLETKVEFVGQETSDALLSNGRLGHKLFGYPQMSAEKLIEQIANWIKNNGYYLDKKTHFETRDGNY